MRIDEQKSHFTFWLEKGDFQSYGHLRIQMMLNALKKSVPASGRAYFAEDKHWRIRNEYRNVFNCLVEKYLVNHQQGLGI